MKFEEETADLNLKQCSATTKQPVKALIGEVNLHQSGDTCRSAAQSNLTIFFPFDSH
jgi:hypothetical protein